MPMTSLNHNKRNSQLLIPYISCWKMKMLQHHIITKEHDCNAKWTEITRTSSFFVPGYIVYSIHYIYCTLYTVLLCPLQEKNLFSGKLMSNDNFRQCQHFFFSRKKKYFGVLLIKNVYTKSNKFWNDCLMLSKNRVEKSR
jgi:hypothetical protein